jgi:hypothetical protein
MACNKLNTVWHGQYGPFAQFLGRVTGQNERTERTIETVARAVLFFYAKNLTRGVL